MTRRLLTAVLAAVFLLGFGIAATGVAAAHSAATGSVPEDNATIDTGPARASVTFNEELQPSFPSLTVVGPDGNLWSKGDPVVEGKTVSVAVGELGPVGEYTIAYRVTSADGHPVSGKRHFTLSKPGNGTPGPKPNAKAGESADDSGGVPLWVFVAGAIVLFGGGLAFALFGGRSRGPKR
ncbi:copper resistance CopC family protein [Nocardia pneumoniae]|uniref:copper resistance CopC family protein n=1 Tax=Nocardia pneumoniae TaxID=228601 RepID=UPI000300E7CD|nr:copper resistance CopC family protein [Nocardia pneumoniae]